MIRSLHLVLLIFFLGTPICQASSPSQPSELWIRQVVKLLLSSRADPALVPMQSPFDEYVAWMMNFAKDRKKETGSLRCGIEILLGLVMNETICMMERNDTLLFLCKTCKHYAIYQYIFEYVYRFTCMYTFYIYNR